MASGILVWYMRAPSHTLRNLLNSAFVASVVSHFLGLFFPSPLSLYRVRVWIKVRVSTLYYLHIFSTEFLVSVSRVLGLGLGLAGRAWAGLRVGQAVLQGHSLFLLFLFISEK